MRTLHSRLFAAASQFQCMLPCTLAFAMLAFAVQLPCAAQDNDGFPRKTGVLDPGVQHPMSELTPDAVFPVSGHPDWLAVTDDALWVTSSSANHVVRLDAATNK